MMVFARPPSRARTGRFATKVFGSPSTTRRWVDRLLPSPPPSLGASHKRTLSSSPSPSQLPPPRSVSCGDIRGILRRALESGGTAVSAQDGAVLLEARSAADVREIAASELQEGC